MNQFTNKNLGKIKKFGNAAVINAHVSALRADENQNLEKYRWISNLLV